ncbi:putative pentatricopeptide repeat-containing protein At1g56570 [Apium graveolens]|uniref:putative pentatricopeptide repeat-containing protein At1g56570 n=1 Tax=Apium graveolens TaxID=4045 RepID=UPI003D7BBDDA
MSYRRLLPNSPHYKIPVNVLGTLKEIKNQAYPSFKTQTPSFLATNLIKSYFEKGLIKEARTLFDEMSERDVVAWTAMISGYASCKYYSNAWQVFFRMLRECGDHPNAFTLSSVLKICKGMNSLSCGALVHGLAVKYGLDGCFYVDNCLMDMYATCCSKMDEACAVFRDMEVRIPVSWTILITGYTHRGDGRGALRVFRQMLVEGVETSPFSISIAVRACTSIGSSTCGMQLHTAVLKCGFDSNIPVMNSILDMYCRCNFFSEARLCFYGMIQRDLITWNIYIAGYEMSHPNESLYIFSQMEIEGFIPNSFTYSSIIAACANLAVLSCGQQVHGGIFQRGLEGDLPLANALIDMYAKCGSIMDSCRIFSKINCKDLVSWTSMMIGYGSHGYGKEAVTLFNEMVKAGIQPDRIVFVAVMGACSHAGMVDEGMSYFKSMTFDYKVPPSQEVYGCVVDLLGRSGRVQEAFELIENMPFKPDESVWGALLGACKAHGIKDLNKRVAQRVLESKPNVAGSYVMLANIFAAQGDWGDFARMRKLMRGTGNKKEAGRSWVEVRDQVFNFVVGDVIGPHIVSAREVIELFGQHMQDETALSPDLDFLFHDSACGASPF